MTTKNNPCDFCRRDEGLVIMPTRYVAVQDGRDETINVHKYNESVEGSYNYALEYELVVTESKERSASESSDQEESVEHSSEVQDTRVVKTDKDTILIDGTYHLFEECDSVKAPKKFGYLQSFLREGYLYVYLEHLDTFEEYLVSKNGYLKKNNTPNAGNEVLEPCDQVQHRLIARTITVPHAKDLTNIYLAYSSVKWTDTVKAKIKNNKQLMRKIDAKKWLTGQGSQGFPSLFAQNDDVPPMVEQYFSIEEETAVGKLLNKIIPIQRKLTDDLLFANSLTINKSIYAQDELWGFGEQHEFRDIYYRVSDLTEDQIQRLNEDKINKMAYLGMIVPLDDPIGLCMDIGTMISGTMTSTRNYNDEEKTLNDVDLLKIAVTRLDNEEFFTDEEREIEKANQMAQGPEAYFFENQAEHLEDPAARLDKEIKSKQVLNEKKLLDWEKNYFSCLSEERYGRAFQSRKAKLEEKEKTIKLLDKWLVDTWRSTNFKNHWIHHYERNDPIQGIAYLWDVVKILLVMPNVPMLLEYLAKSTTMHAANKENCLIQAFCLNSDAVHATMASSLSQSTIATIPWGDLLSRFNAYIQLVKSKELKASLYAGYNLLVLKFNPVIEFMIQKKNHWCKFSKDGIALIHPATIGVAAVQGKIVSEFDVAYRNKGQFNQAIVNFLKSQHLRVYGTKNGFNDNRMGHLISKEPYWQSLYKKNENRGKTSLSIPMITENKAIPASMSPDEFFELVTKQTKQASILPQTTDVQQRANVHVNPALETKLFTDPKVALNKMALTGNFLLQSWALMTMWNDPTLESTRDNFYEKHGKLAAGFIGVAMASLEGISYLLNVYVNFGAKINSKIIKVSDFLSDLTNIESKLWRGLGSVVGFIFGAYDVYNGWKAFNEKDEVLYGGG